MLMKSIQATTLLFLFLSPILTYHTYNNMGRDLQQSIEEKVRRQIERAERRANEMIKKAKAKGNSGFTVSQSNNGNSSMVSIVNGKKVTKTFKNGKLVSSKTSKVKNNGNSINMINSGPGRSYVSVNGHTVSGKRFGNNGNVAVNVNEFDNRKKGKKKHNKKKPKHTKPKHNKKKPVKATEGKKKKEQPKKKIEKVETKESKTKEEKENKKKTDKDEESKSSLKKTWKKIEDTMSRKSGEIFKNFAVLIFVFLSLN